MTTKNNPKIPTIGTDSIPVSRLIAGFVCAICFALIGLEASSIIGERSKVLADARKETANLTSSLVQHADLTFRTADALLVGIVERLEHGDLSNQAARQRLRNWFRKEADLNPLFASFAVIDRDGRMVVSSASDAPSSDFSDRDHFIYHRDHDSRAFRIGKPVKARSADGWIIPTTRRFNQPSGEFGGVAVAALNPGYFQASYDGLDLGKNGAVLLASMDGTLLVRRPFVESNIGRDLSQGGIFRELKRSPSGSAEIVAATDGVRRFNSYEQARDYPVVVAVARDIDELLAPWRQGAARQAAVALFVVTFIALMGAIVWRITRALAVGATELEIVNNRFDAALSNMSQGISMFDKEKRLVVWNARYTEIFAFPPGYLRPGIHVNTLAEDLLARGVLKGERTRSAIEQKVAIIDRLSIDSSWVEELADGRFILISRRQLGNGGWLATSEDITERRRAEAEVVRLARHDTLTGLANRAEFNARLDEAGKRVRRYGGAITVMMLDLDKFKVVNDTLGHPAGDKLLVEVAARLKATLRETDLLARLGGDEFAIIQEGGANQHEGAISLALRIIHSISQPFDLDGHRANVGTSIGIALAPEHGADPEDLLKKADLALYAVKAAGRNDYRIFQPDMLEAVNSQHTAEGQLRDALAREEFELHYQPMIDASTRELRAVEALVRWNHPTRGLIGPDQFIPLAESTGLIVPLGDWVLQRACADAVSWPANIKVAVNISALQFKKGNLFDIVLCTLVETGLAPDRLELEITETMLLENREEHLASIRQLKNLGISLAIDDFGTGYASINYLAVFPFDKIKIDKSFTQGARQRRECRAVVASTLALARELGIPTAAEGIETEEQFDCMRAAGVDLMQGYLFGRPVPASLLDFSGAAGRKELVA